MDGAMPGLETPCWRWAGARVTGEAHRQHGEECQDALACKTVTTAAEGECLVADGAGSARQGAVGARISSRGFVRLASRAMYGGATTASLGRTDVLDWLDAIREEIHSIAARSHEPLRAYATTLVGVVASASGMIVAHIGDGAAAMRKADDKTWHVPSWPRNGEYANTTFFVTDEVIKLCVVRRRGPIDAVALFTDGVEDMALERISYGPHVPFFEPMIQPLAREKVVAGEVVGRGRDRPLSRALMRFLASERVARRSSDDRTLLLAKAD